ncbi:MAG: phosphoribosylanthranilate isomerase [Phycisphaerales bacterium]|nr:MAG: phosphoribosylanthranilate isomerase [Phycisphaerales bacterium]
MRRKRGERGMARTRIKICGVRDAGTAMVAAEAGADAVGFVFVRGSTRYIDPDEAFEVMASLPPFVASVGVYVVEDVNAFTELEQRCPTVHTQLHGDEDERLVEACGPAIKAVRFDPGRGVAALRGEVERWSAMPDVEAVLIDGPAPGSGEVLDWASVAEAIAGVETRVILAGGLTPENVAGAIRTVRPYGVDVSSGVEREPGVKDAGLIAAFCEAVHAADAG